MQSLEIYIRTILNYFLILQEPLRVSLSTHLRNILQGVLNSIGDLLEQAIHIITNDNLDLGCAMVEQAATDKVFFIMCMFIMLFTYKIRTTILGSYQFILEISMSIFLLLPPSLRQALQSIDGEISPFLSFTKKQREGCSSPYFDVNVYAQGSFACVPESLRAKPGRLSSSQQRVYEVYIVLIYRFTRILDYSIIFFILFVFYITQFFLQEFVKYPWNNQSSQIPSVVPVIGQINSSSISSTPRSGQLNPGIYKMPSTSSGFVGVSQSYEFPPDAVDPNSIKMLRSCAFPSTCFLLF